MHLPRLIDCKPVLLIGFLIVLLLISPVQGSDADKKEPHQDKKKSPWIFTPVFSSDPKISTSGGAMVAYMHKFDQASPMSLVGVTGTYSTTDSYFYGGFWRLFFNEDKHRLSGVLGRGKIKNDYSDFLGSGLSAQTTDDLKLFAIRYHRRVKGLWYIGPQFISTNYAISGDAWLSGEILDKIGLTGFDSNGIGLAIKYDSRDNQNSPASGQVFEIHNIAYRQSFGGDASFDTYTAAYKYYHPHGQGHVFAAHLKGRWTHNAPTSGYSSVELRGYVRGQSLAPHMTMAEVEERFYLYKKWGLIAFAGIAGLYGEDNGHDNSGKLYPAAGVGISYQLNDEKMVVRVEVAAGKEGNQGFYMKFGHPF